MTTNNSKKARLNIDCTPDEKRLIRLLAAKEDKSVSQYILSLARNEMQKVGLVDLTKEFWSILSNSNTAKQENRTLIPINDDQQKDH